MRSTFQHLLTIAMVFLFGAASLVQAELKPEQIAIIANKQSQQSQQLAAYYAKVRGIPTTQICVVDMPTDETLERSVWDRSVRPAIRRWVATNQLQNKLRCMVTVWDVPLKIGKTTTDDTNTARRRRLLQLERVRRVERLISFIGQFDAIAPDGTTPPAVTVNAGSPIAEITRALQDRLRACEQRVQALLDPEAKSAAVRRLTQLSVGTAGLQVVTQNLQRTIQSGNTDPRVNDEMRFGMGRLSGLGEGQSLLDGLPATVERDTNIIALVERAIGIAGTVSWIDGQLDLLKLNETHASFDSELSLVLEGTYPLLRWLPNYLHYNYDGSPLRQITRTMMVSRLEAPTLPLTKALIDNAIAVEQQGLTGKVYLDARGLVSLNDQPPARGTDADYDRALLLADKLLRENTNLEVVLNSENGLFGPNECPDAALYCGWFSLAKYIDSFQWTKGAVGYHMSGAEASTIRKADSQVWCKQMLDRGAAATIGPVFDPVMLAYPRPNEFFALLCSGKYTYAECVYRTKVTNSWTMTAVGDPLYNPFKAKPALTTTPPEYERLFQE